MQCAVLGTPGPHAVVFPQKPYRQLAVALKGRTKKTLEVFLLPSPFISLMGCLEDGG